jgi:NADH-quinone oxidoreductase subunit H
MAVLVVLSVALMFVGDSGRGEAEEAEPEPSAQPEGEGAYAGGFPVPPMPTGGAVRGAAAPLTFATSRTTVTASAEEDSR